MRILFLCLSFFLPSFRPYCLSLVSPSFCLFCCPLCVCVAAAPRASAVGQQPFYVLSILGLAFGCFAFLCFASLCFPFLSLYLSLSRRRRRRPAAASASAPPYGKARPRTGPGEWAGNVLAAASLHACVIAIARAIHLHGLGDQQRSSARLLPSFLPSFFPCRPLSFSFLSSPGVNKLATCRAGEELEREARK